MTKEEINEEACEHCNWAMCSVCENRTCDNTHLATLKCREQRDRRAGYYCGAESREKRIAELNKKLSEAEADYDKMFWNKNEIISKAKKIIENIIRVTWGEGWNYSLDWKVKAEQLLKEADE